MLLHSLHLPLLLKDGAEPNPGLSTRIAWRKVVVVVMVEVVEMVVVKVVVLTMVVAEEKMTRIPTTWLMMLGLLRAFSTPRSTRPGKRRHGDPYRTLTRTSI